MKLLWKPHNKFVILFPVVFLVVFVVNERQQKLNKNKKITNESMVESKEREWDGN